MSYPQEIAEQLSQKIKLYQAHKVRPVNAAEYNLEPENIWGASFFFSDALVKTSLPDNLLISEARLKELVDQFNAANGFEIVLDDLFNRGWLRIIYGAVTIPTMIISAIHDFEKIKGFETEFKYFRQLSPEFRKSIVTEEMFVASAAAYGNEDNLDIRLTQTRGKFWNLKNERVEFYGTDFYSFLFGHFAEFQFLASIKDLKADMALSIKQSDLSEIHLRHIAYFRNAPAISNLIEQGLFKVIGDGEYLSVELRQSGWAHEAMMDKTGALLWKLLLDDSTFADDDARLNFWYHRTVFFNGYVNIENFFGQAEKARFLAAALNYVLTEPDISNGDAEYLKLKMDSRHSYGRDIILNGGMEGDKEHLLASDDLFEMYRHFETFNHGHGEDLVITQESRHALGYFIVQLVKSDNKSCNHIKSLCAHAKDKPYVFWDCCFMLHHWRPDLLPFLAIADQTASLAFSLILRNQVSSYFGKEEKNIKDQLSVELFSLIAFYLSVSPSIPGERKAEILFQCLLLSTIGKFKDGPDQDDRRIVAKEIRRVIADTELPGISYDGNLKIKNLFYPGLLDDLFKLLKYHKTVDIYENGMLTLPVVELDITDLLFELAFTKNSKAEIIGTSQQFHDYSQLFINTYLDAVNQQEIKKRDFGDGELKTVLPSWSSRGEGELQIKWGRLFLYLEQTNQLDELLSPVNLAFTNTEERYDEFNRFVANKLRTHVLILINAFNEIYQEQRQLKIAGFPVESVLSKIENKITNYVIRYSSFSPAEKRYDIFNEHLERWFGRNKKNELLPLIGSILNRFQKENRQAIIKELIKKEQLLRSLKLLEDIVSEQERNRLLNIITKDSDIVKIFDKLSFQDMQFVVMSLSTNERFLDSAEDALAYTELFAGGHKWGPHEQENQVFIYRMKLLQAYQKGSSDELEAISPIGITHFQGHNFSSNDEKDFYRALLFLKNQDGEAAYHLFNELVAKSSDERPVLALNRFASKLKWVEITKDLVEKKALALSALHEWESFEHSYPPNKSWPSIGENISFNKLHAFEILEEFVRFDQEYDNIDIGVKMRADFLEIRVTTFMYRKMKMQAENLLAEARQFHMLENGNYPDFIYALEKSTYADESLDYLAIQYDRIFRLSPEELIQVIPDSLNDGKNLSGFLLNEIIAATKDMLTLINSLPKVGHEDKYSDLIMLSLKGRLLNFKWHPANLRAGFSDPDDQKNGGGSVSDADNLGEIDFGVYRANGERIAICEAMILEGRNAIEVQKHNLKVFNYDPDRKLYFIISYYKGGPESFVKGWESYIQVVEDFIEFPILYPLVGKVTELKKDVLNGPIRIGKSLHGGNTELYHIFINVNYKLPIKKKKVRETMAAKK